MKQKTVKKNFTIVCRIIAVLLVLSVILSFCGCDDNEITSSSELSSSNVSGDDNNDTDNSNSENTSSIDPLSGEFHITDQVTQARDDAGEIKPTGNCASLSNPLTGYADRQAEELREKIVNSGNTANHYKITGTTYYISPGGNDLNEGTSPQTALRTLDGLDSVTLNEGDAVLFERNSVFRIIRPISAKEGVLYGSYGTGSKPAIYASPANFSAPNVWMPTKKANVWQANFTYDPAGGMIFEHGKSVGVMKSGGIIALAANEEFFHDTVNGMIYLYCDKGNPSNVYKSIEIMPSTYIFNIPNGVGNVTIDNLCLKYSAYHGISSSYGSNNITVTNCEIGYIGGRSTGTVRMGNAFEVWQGAKNIRFEQNWVYQVFDTAISWQGQGGEACVYENISFSNNLLEYNNADIEFFETKGAVVKNFKMDNNIMRFTCMGWGTRADDGGIRGIEGCIRANTPGIIIEDISFRNNIIDCPARQIVNWSLASGQKITASGNKVYVKASLRTTQEVIRGLQINSNDPSMVDASNLAELKAAFDRFDPTALLNWFE